MRKYLILALLACVTLMLSSCGSQSEPSIKPGTPAFFWAGAKDAHAKGNFTEAADKLRNVTGSDNEFRERASSWLMVLSAGLARGEMEWADAMAEGMKMSRTQQNDFRKAANAARTAANQHAMTFTELSHAARAKGLPAEIPLVCVMPAMDAAKPVEAGKIAKGILPPPAEIEKMRTQWQRRGVLMALARAAGTGEDLEKAKAALANGDLKIKKEAWFLVTAKEFAVLAELYQPKKLDLAARAKLMIDEGVEALAEAPSTKETKELQKQFDALKKKLPKPTS